MFRTSSLISVKNNHSFVKDIKRRSSCIEFSRISNKNDDILETNKNPYNERIKQTICDYTENSDNINIHLVSGGCMSEELRQMDYNLQALFNSSNKDTKKIIHSMRGTYLPWKTLGKSEYLEEGCEYYPGYYLSTTTNKTTAEAFALAHIKRKKSTIFHIFGSSGVSIETMSTYPEEQEILYSKETKFTVLLKHYCEKTKTTFVVIDEIIS